MRKKKKPEKVSMTVRLPRSIYKQAKAMVENHVSNLGSLNDFIVAAALSFLRAARRRQIDLAFKGMSEDREFQKESQLVAEEFESSDWEAFQVGEKQ